MKIAKPIDSDPEVRQAAFTAMREMANLVMDNAGFDGWSDYPWEAIDNVQQHLEAAQDAGDAARIRKVTRCINALRLWYITIIQLNNTANIPDENEHNWYAG